MKRRCYVPPDAWEAIEKTPTTRDGWLDRLGRPGGYMALAGAMGRGELVERGGLIGRPEDMGVKHGRA